MDREQGERQPAPDERRAEAVSEAPRPLRLKPRPCAICGQVFTSWNAAAKYCSTVCRAKANDARRLKRSAPTKEEG